MFVLLLLVGAVLPLAIAPGLLFHFDVSPKTIVLGLAAAAALLRTRAIPGEMAALWSRRGGRALVCLATLQALWTGIATAASTNPGLSLAGSAWRQFGFLTTLLMLVTVVLIAGNLCSRPQNAGLLLRIVAIAGIAASFYGVAQYFDLDPFQPSVNYQAHAGDSVIVRPPGTLGHADYFAWWLSIEALCGLALAKRSSGIWRAVGFGCVAFTGIAILLTGTRAAYVAIVAGMIAFALLTRFKFKKKHASTALLLIAIPAGFYFSPAGTRLRARAAWSGEEPAGGARPLLWRDSIRMAGSKPIAGFGPETFQSAFGLWQSAELARLYPDFHHESPHNVALDALTSMGIPGLLLLIAWGVAALGSAARAIRVQPKVAAPLAAALVASFTASLFDAAGLGPVILSLLVLSLIVSAEPPELRRSIATPRWIVIAVCGIMAICACTFAGTVATADYRLAVFQRAPSRPTGEAALRWELPATAEDIYVSRVLLNLCQSVTAITARIECWREAEQVAARATGTAGDPANAWYNLAEFTAAQNDIRGTEMALRKAIGVAPNWFKPHWTLARLLAQTEHLKEAVIEGQRAAILNSGHDAEVSDTARQLRSRLPSANTTP
ncbi:MAG TPA: O-antigen ligase family protein [Bryobacteraceae bacterium]|nr:O-antigen ligase family protein [Bryobacteraceae bacterium]